MFVVSNRIPVKEEFNDDFIQRFEKRAKGVEAQPGFVDFKLLKPQTTTRNRETGEVEKVAEQGVFVVQTIWADEDSFWAWTKSDDFRQAHADKPPSEMFAGKSQMEIHEVVIGDVKA